LVRAARVDPSSFLGVIYAFPFQISLFIRRPPRPAPLVTPLLPALPVWSNYGSGLSIARGGRTHRRRVSSSLPLPKSTITITPTPIYHQAPGGREVQIQFFLKGEADKRERERERERERTRTGVRFLGRPCGGGGEAQAEDLIWKRQTPKDFIDCSPGLQPVSLTDGKTDRSLHHHHHPKRSQRHQRPLYHPPNPVRKDARVAALPEDTPGNWLQVGGAFGFRGGLWGPKKMDGVGVHSLRGVPKVTRRIWGHPRSPKPAVGTTEESPKSKTPGPGLEQRTAHGDS
jgi:hypothetical protein